MTGAFSGDKMGIRTQKAWAERGRRQLTRENAMEYIKAQSPAAFLLKAKKGDLSARNAETAQALTVTALLKILKMAGIIASSAVKSAGIYLTL